MHVFTDTANRRWAVDLTVATLKRVRALAGVDLMAAVGGDLLERLAGDPVLLADVLFAVVKPEADALGVTDTDFGCALAGDSIADATTALLEGLVDFFPNPRRRLLATALAKLTSWQRAAIQAAQDRLDSPALEQAVAAAVARVSPPCTDQPPPGVSSGASPAWSASIPDH